MYRAEEILLVSRKDLNEWADVKEIDYAVQVAISFSLKGTLGQ